MIRPIRMVRGRIELGVRSKMQPGLALDISGSYDGIGTTGYCAVTGRATVRVPF